MPSESPSRYQPNAADYRLMVGPSADHYRSLAVAIEQLSTIIADELVTGKMLTAVKSAEKAARRAAWMLACDAYWRP